MLDSLYLLENVFIHFLLQNSTSITSEPSRAGHFPARGLPSRADITRLARNRREGLLARTARLARLARDALLVANPAHTSNLGKVGTVPYTIRVVVKSRLKSSWL
jgi:hypothetical protein